MINLFITKLKGQSKHKMQAFLSIRIKSIHADEGVLKQILSEVKASNGLLTDKLTKLKQKVSELQDDVDPPAKKKRKLVPSREVRVIL